MTNKIQPNSQLESPILDYKPDAWIYNYAVLAWIFEPALGNQLPILYQIFRVYAYCYFRITHAPNLKGGRPLFQFLASILGKITSRDFKITLPDYEIFVDLLDARFFQVVNELKNSHSDIQVLSHLLSTGDTFMDIGANHGSFSIAASKLVGTKGRIISVEPQPHLAKIVEKSLAINALGDFQVHAIAVGNLDGEIELLIPRGTSGSAGIFAEHSATEQFKGIMVPLKRIDDFIEWQSLTGKVLIKLDIEGSESAFLMGAAKMIKQLKPTLIMEIHPGTLKASNITGEDLKQLLQELGYKNYAEIDHLQVTFPLSSLNTLKQRNIVIYQN
jgi:FkbM family methyltransferase